MPQLKVNDTPWDSKYPKTVPSIEVDLVRINDKPTGRDQIFNVHLWWVAARCWETRPWVWQCRNSLSLDRRSHCTLSTPEHTLAPKLGSGSPTFLEGSIVVFVHLLFCFSVAFLVTQSLDRLSLACAKAWGLATSPCFSHDNRGAIVKVMEILSLHRHSGDRPSYRVELRVFGSLFAIQKYRTPFLFPCSGECWYAVAVEIFKLARLLPLLRAFFPQLLYFTLNLTRLGVYCEGGEGAHSNAPLLS